MGVWRKWHAVVKFIYHLHLITTTVTGHVAHVSDYDPSPNITQISGFRKRKNHRKAGA